MLPRILVCLGAFWSFSVAQQRLDLYEGDICKETPGALWTCKARKDCPTAGGLSDGNTVQECNSQGSEPIVCCEPSLKQHTDVGTKTRLKM
ncbi:hypothetical protein J6590_015255 [Homalodisca vitripennis]|nr:hypothetical protein J6590_015255 [Homalodisca vitripennis]